MFYNSFILHKARSFFTCIGKLRYLYQQETIQVPSANATNRMCQRNQS